MATQAHCAFCFETLAANFERRQALTLPQVEELWERYHALKDSRDAVDDGEDDEDDEDAEERAEDAGMADVDAESEQQPVARPAAISRLLHRDPSAASSSSSLPSTRSGASSTQGPRPRSGADTPASSSSSVRSRSSLFSFARRRRSDSKNDAKPLFVTWNAISRNGHKSLRGCVGTFEAQDIESGLKSYALTSAFEDVRFSPIPPTQLPALTNHVTLLINFSQPTKDPLDWTLGTHGIRISFTSGGRRYGATYLPDVAQEQGWTKEETLISLMRKSGWSGGSSGWAKTWRDGKGELVRYEGKAVGLGYEEWRAWREWVEREGVKGTPLN